MFAFIKSAFNYLKNHPRIPVVAMDLSVIPGIFVGRWVIRQMFRFGGPCNWERFGLKCATCGGTHCVQSLLRGDLVAAFLYNPMVFCWILYGALTVVLLNLRFVCNQAWAGKMLQKMYSFCAFLIGVLI